ncbi:hypothetical protein [Pseudoalteromonas sp. S16_S37]|nr:hypothetical protein [Pseudoalteromonas sp. S16_S37]MBD1581044.1 hypothetical protein [Pseudoalteromonas sp. S16_S37]
MATVLTAEFESSCNSLSIHLMTSTLSSDEQSCAAPFELSTNLMQRVEL